MDLATRVKRYNFLRAQEYAAYREKYSDLPASEFPPQYNTEHHHCPCGNPTTCPDHENETLGAFPGYFWKLPPGNPHYLACLRDHNLPYRDVL